MERNEKARGRIMLHHGVENKKGKQPDIIYIPTTPPTPAPAQIMMSSLCKKIASLSQATCYDRRRCGGECHGPHGRAGDDATEMNRHRPLQAGDDAMGNKLSREGKRRIVPSAGKREGFGARAEG